MTSRIEEVQKNKQRQRNAGESDLKKTNLKSKYLDKELQTKQKKVTKKI